jgi:hypothetical protein
MPPDLPVLAAFRRRAVPAGHVPRLLVADPLKPREQALQAATRQSGGCSISSDWKRSMRPLVLPVRVA